MAEQKGAAVEYTQEELETMTKAVLNGATIGDVCNISQDMLESLYSLGYNLYTSGNYKDAETIFSGLCLYDHEFKEACEAFRKAPVDGSKKDKEAKG